MYDTHVRIAVHARNRSRTHSHSLKQVGTSAIMLPPPNYNLSRTQPHSLTLSRDSARFSRSSVPDTAVCITHLGRHQLFALWATSSSPPPLLHAPTCLFQVGTSAIMLPPRNYILVHEDGRLHTRGSLRRSERLNTRI